jgi:hypothetical protein
MASFMDADVDRFMIGGSINSNVQEEKPPERFFILYGDSSSHPAFEFTTDDTRNTQ